MSTQTVVTVKQIEKHLGKKFAHSIEISKEYANQYILLSQVLKAYSNKNDNNVISLITDCKKDKLDELRTVAKSMFKSVYNLVYDTYNKNDDDDHQNWEILAIDQLYDAFDLSEISFNLTDPDSRKTNFDKLYRNFPTINNAHPLAHLRKAMYYYIHHDDKYFISQFPQMYSDLIWLNTVLTFGNKDFEKLFK